MNNRDNLLEMNLDTIQSETNHLIHVLENSPSLISFKDLSGRFINVNKKFYDAFGLTEKDIIGKTVSEVFSTSCVDHDINLDLQVITDLKTIESEVPYTFNGTEFIFISARFPLKDHSGNIVGVGCILTDITQRKAMEQRLDLAQRIIDNTSEGVVVTDTKGAIIDLNHAYTQITGYEREDLIGKNPKLLKSGRHDAEFYKAMWAKINATGYWSGEIWDRRKNGQVYPKWLTINAITDELGVVTSYVGIFNDITEKKRTEQELEHLAYYDALTQLPNRILFKDRLNHTVANAKRDDNEIAVLIIDLARFKYVNDTLGHEVGDELLEIIAKQLKEIVRESDSVARLGGNEFAVILSELRLPEDASIVSQNIINTLTSTYTLKGQTVNIGASIGISTYPEDGTDTNSLIKHAELAVYKAKDLGRNNYQFFSQELQDAVFDLVAFEAEIRTAINEDQLALYYQPKIDLATRKVIGMEALVRWIHPEKGLIPPDHFIPFAEECGLILPMGDWILRTACRQSAIWSAQLEEPLVVAINLSAKQFKQKELLGYIQELLVEHDIDPKHIELEITESSVMDDVEGAIDIMHSFRNKGLKLAMDDFGTGYSSLSYLKRFPINTLKIDQSFVRDLTIDSDDAAIVEVIISLADKLKLDVVAEGVETQDQLDFLTDKGCQNVQGYFLSRPLPVDDFTQYISNYSAK